MPVKKQRVRLSDGLIKQNTVLMSGLFATPVIAAANSVMNSVVICFVFTLVTLLSVALCCFVPKKIVFAVRIATYALIASAVYFPIMLLTELIFPQETIANIGIYLSIIVTNPLILSKTESRFLLRPFGAMMKDAFGFVLGFDIACLLVGALRDIMVNNMLGNIPLNLPTRLPIMGTTAGGFILVGLLAGLFRAFYNRYKKTSGGSV